MPGLKKAHFAMPPRWLKPVERINSTYSTITFAISDPDGSITSKLLNGRTALFGKEVLIQRWVDKPPLVQCSRCHELGHIKTSKACKLSRDSVKCYICGGSHHTDSHDQKCNRKHAIAGICDCMHFKCLNCHKTGHNCKDMRCPERDLYRPRTNRRRKKPKNGGMYNDWAPEEELNVQDQNTATEDPPDSDGDLYEPVPTRTRPLSRQARRERTARVHERIENICATIYNTDEYLEALNCPQPMDTDLAPAGPMEYSPSCPQGDTATAESNTA